MSCCSRPDPRVIEKTGRFYCANCRRYLDRPGVASQDRASARQNEPDDLSPPSATSTHPDLAADDLDVAP